MEKIKSKKGGVMLTNQKDLDELKQMFKDIEESIVKLLKKGLNVILYWLPYLLIASLFVSIMIVFLAYILPTAQDLMSVANVIIKGFNL